MSGSSSVPWLQPLADLTINQSLLQEDIKTSLKCCSMATYDSLWLTGRKTSGFSQMAGLFMAALRLHQIMVLRGIR